MSDLLLAGDGWGAIAAFNSLKQSNKHYVSLLSNNENRKADLIRLGYRCVNDFEGVYDLIITAGYKPLIPQRTVDTNVILNVHYSLLPSYRGLHSTVWALLNDEPFLGLTVHRMNRNIDDGPLVYQYSVPNDFVSSSTYYMQLFNAHIEKVLLGVVDDYLSGKLRETEQDRSMASWVGRRKAVHCSIDFAKPLTYQKAFFRALTPPYPYPYFLLNQEKFEVHQADFYPTTVATDRGRILNIDDNGVWISCEKGYVICRKIFSPNRNAEICSAYFRVGQFVAGFG